jgi:hypothetical protein
MKRYEVQTKFANGDWENCWLNDDETPVTFASRAEATAYINEFIAGMETACKKGNLIDAYSKAFFRIRVVK